MKNQLSCSFLFACLFLSLVFVSGYLGEADASVGVQGIISSDVTWTANEGPYNLTDNTLIESGVTVTVHSGATVNLNGYYIRVNGSLILQPGVTVNFGSSTNLGWLDINGVLSAKGTSGNPIYFNGVIGHSETILLPNPTSSIRFEASSVNWVEQTGSGCIIEHAVINKMNIMIASSAKFYNNQLTNCGEFSIAGGSPVISHNSFSESSYQFNAGGDHPIITHNVFAGTKLVVSGGSPFIANNQLDSGLSIYGSVGSVTITSNAFSSAGIYVSGNNHVFQESILIEKNVVKDAAVGIEITQNQRSERSTPITVRYNTVTGNDVGISVAATFSHLTITNNNLYSNDINFKLSYLATNDVPASNNWWGTTNTAAIDQSIIDFNDNNFDFGKVLYTPILTSPDPIAPDPNQPIPDAVLVSPTIAPSESPTSTSSSNSTQSPTSSPTETSPFSPTLNPTSTPDQPGTPVLMGLDWAQIAIIILLVVVAALLVVILFLRRKNSNQLPPPPP